MKQKMDEFLHNKGWLRALPFALLFAYLIAIYQTVPIFWDDYSFASLSFWGYTQPDVAGTNWTIPQLIEFCVYAYKHFIGRTFFMIFLNDLLLRELWLYRIIASLATTIIFYMLYRFSGVTRNLINAFAVCVCYGLFSRRMFTDTMYYWAGTIAYIIPIIFMFASIFLFREIRSNGNEKKVLCILLVVFSFITCIAQEQISFTYCVMIGLYCLYDLITLRRIRVYQWITLIVSAVGACLLYLAPGNFSRLTIQDYLKEPSYLQQVYKNVKMFFATVYQKDNLPFLLVFVAFMIFLAYLELIKKKASDKSENYRINKTIFLAFCMWSSVVFLQSMNCRADATVFYWDPTTATDAYVINVLLYSEVSGVLLYKQLKRLNDSYLTLFLVSSLITVIVTFIYSYYITVRMIVPLMFAIFAVMLRIFGEIKAPWRAVTFSSVAIIACLWLTFFMHGYYKNAPVLRTNDELLTSMAARLRAGEPTLLDGLSEDWNWYFLPERVYAHDVDRGVLEYYDFPDDVFFVPSPPEIIIESFDEGFIS